MAGGSAAAHTLLIAEDDPRMAHLIQRALFEEGFRSILAADGEEAIDKVKQVAPDALILDLMLPKQDGLAVCRALRAERIGLPILMLTARDTVADRVRGLDAGADDYLTKPFALDELLARVRVLLRRAKAGPAASWIEVGGLRLDVNIREAYRGQEAVSLTRTEFDVLAYLMRNAGRVLSRDQIFDEVWGETSSAKAKVVDVYVCYLRAKLDGDGGSATIRTVRGAGYTISPRV